VAAGNFRPDLFYRLAVLSVTLPALRNRREDIAPIVAELLRRRGLDPGNVGGDSLARLQAHAWPGNVRELRNVIDRAIALSPGARRFDELRIQLVPQEEGGAPVRTDLPFKDAKDAVIQYFERAYVRALHERHSGNVSAAAREAQVDRKHWRSLLRAHGVLAEPSDDDEA
jgi:DNA-binding NtrC family response regulator